MKIATVILSFIFVVCVSTRVTQAEKIDRGGISVNIKHVNGNSSGVGKYEKKYSAITNEDGTSTPSLIVYNATVWLTTDYNGNDYYQKVQYWFDVDTDSSESVSYYAIFYMDTNDGYGWYQAFESEVYTLENGYSPEEGLYFDLYFYSGYKQKKIDVQIKVYRKNGELACIFGPDEDSDLSQTPVEAGLYDVKEDPFITTPSPTPSPTPTPAPTIDEIKLNDSVEGNRLTLRKGESVNVAAEALSGGEAISGAEIKAETEKDTVSVSPSVATTDENGLAEFTITANKKGNAKIIFSSGGAETILRVKVK